MFMMLQLSEIATVLAIVVVMDREVKEQSQGHRHLWENREAKSMPKALG